MGNPRKQLRALMGDVDEGDEEGSDDEADFLDEDAFEDAAPPPTLRMPDLPPPQPYMRAEEKRVGRNDRCPCGSGKKFKHCCMRKKS